MQTFNMLLVLKTLGAEARAFAAQTNARGLIEHVITTHATADDLQRSMRKLNAETTRAHLQSFTCPILGYVHTSSSAVYHRTECIALPANWPWLHMCCDIVAHRQYRCRAAEQPEVSLDDLAKSRCIGCTLIDLYALNRSLLSRLFPAFVVGYA